MAKDQTGRIRKGKQKGSDRQRTPTLKAENAKVHLEASFDQVLKAIAHPVPIDVAKKSSKGN